MGCRVRPRRPCVSATGAVALAVDLNVTRRVTWVARAIRARRPNEMLDTLRQTDEAVQIKVNQGPMAFPSSAGAEEKSYLAQQPR